MASWSEHEWAQRWIALTQEQPAEGRVVWVWLSLMQVKAYRSGEDWLLAETGEKIVGVVITHFMWVRGEHGTQTDSQVVGDAAESQQPAGA